MATIVSTMENTGNTLNMVIMENMTDTRRQRHELDRNHKNLVYRIAVGAAALSLTCFIWTGVQLYRGRKVLEAEIAARNHGKQYEVQEDSMCSFSGDVVKYKESSTDATAMSRLFCV